MGVLGKCSGGEGCYIYLDFTYSYWNVSKDLSRKYGSVEYTGEAEARVTEAATVV